MLAHFAFLDHLFLVGLPISAAPDPSNACPSTPSARQTPKRHFRGPRHGRGPTARRCLTQRITSSKFQKYELLKLFIASTNLYWHQNNLFDIPHTVIPKTLEPMPPWRQPWGKWHFRKVNSPENRPGSNPGANGWSFSQLRHKMPPRRSGICEGLT